MTYSGWALQIIKTVCERFSLVPLKVCTQHELNSFRETHVVVLQRQILSGGVRGRD